MASIQRASAVDDGLVAPALLVNVLPVDVTGHMTTRNKRTTSRDVRDSSVRRQYLVVNHSKQLLYHA